jgi:hypothetical protein
MAKLDLAAVQGPMQAEVRLDGGRISLRLAGTADMRSTTALHLFLTKLHMEAQRIDASQVQVDLRHLEFMNSSCFKEFVTWISDVRESAGSSYRIEFLSNPEILWQRRSLHALCGFADDLVTVTTEKTAAKP